MITWPVLLLWVLILAAALSRGPLMLYLFAGTVIFDSLTMLPASVTGGANVLPQSLCAVFLVAKIMSRPGNLSLAMRLAFDLRKFGFLSLFWIVVLLSAIFLPRLFAGAVSLFPLNDTARGLQPLAPSSGNLTQTAYLTLSIGVALAFAVAGRDPEFRAHYFRAVLLAGILLIGSGLLDLALSTGGREALLAPFHNAGYAQLTDVDLGGQKRVVGFMPEASSYGSVACVTAAFLIFGYRLFSARLRRLALPVTIAVLVIMTFLSTSSTGYVGLLTIILLALGRAIYDALLARRRSLNGLIIALGLATAGLCILGLAILLLQDTIAKYRNIIDITLFEKTASASYLERSSWTAAGFAAFLATHGIGVGVGSVRTSNWYVNLLASTGFVGALLFALFVLEVLLGWFARGARAARPFILAMALTLLPSAVMIGLAGTTPDPGVWVMSILGLIAGAGMAPAGLTSDALSPSRRNIGQPNPSF